MSSDEMFQEGSGVNPEVYKVIGAPGTGKTTRVVGNPELDLNGLFIENLDEYSFDEQMLVTYTNAGVDEAADRLSTMLNGSGGRPKVPKYKIDDRVTTIHGQCYRLLSLDREQVVQFWHKNKFCEAFDLEFGYESDSGDDIMAQDKKEGNALFEAYGWLQDNRLDNSEWEEYPNELPIDEDPEWLMDRWDEWKESKNLVGFGDMIEKVVEMGFRQLKNLGWGVLFVDEDTTTLEMFEKAREDPQRDADIIRGKGAFINTKVLYVDEVQDLTPLQWEWYLLQKLACEKVFIGGDDDQTIYGWSGANPEFMLDEEGDFEVLEKTYRIPYNIWNICNGVIQQVDKRQEKTVEPHGDGGEFVLEMRPSKRQLIEHLKEGEWMVLFRARYQIDEFRNALHQHGIAYRNMSTFDTWSDDMVKLRDGLCKLENNGEQVKGDELDAMMEFAEDDMLNKNSGVTESEKVMGMLGGISPDRLDEIFHLQNSYGKQKLTARAYLNATDELNYYEKEAIRGAVLNGNKGMDPDRIRIGTIHSSKGKEAPNVMVATDSTQTILANMFDDPASSGDAYTQQGLSAANVPTGISDAERRVYYVGMTRASEKLVLAEGVIDPETAVSASTILGDDWQEFATETGKQTEQQTW